MVTDTGALREMLDLAQQRWPDVRDRRELLLRLAAAGGDAIAEGVEEGQLQVRRQRQREAFERAPDLVDVDALLADGAWR